MQNLNDNDLPDFDEETILKLAFHELALDDEDTEHFFIPFSPFKTDKCSGLIS